MRLIRILVPALALVASIASCSSGREPARPGAQLSFGVEMARRGLWSEALFRFQQAERLDPGNARVYNNLAVASEALGRFEDAQRYYQEALSRAPQDEDLRRNYARFVEFYQAFKGGEGPAEGEAPQTGGPQTGESSSGDG
jgi:Flp pilus assembly protein TadD